MKQRGEDRVWSSIRTKQGNFKNISSTQVGQQILFEDTLKILPGVKKWINEGAGKSYRRMLKQYFNDEEILIEKILQSFLFLAGTINNGDGSSKSNRHKKVNTLRSRIMPELDFEIVWRFLEVIIDLSQYFSVEKLLNYDKTGYKWSFRYNSLLSEVILEKLALESAEAFYPLPMLTPPVNWSFDKESGLKGGYDSYQFEMIRASREIDYSLYGQQIFDSINYIQSTPWIVNESMLEVVKKNLQIPIKSDFVKAEYPETEGCHWDIDLKTSSLSDKEKESIEKDREVFREKVDLYKAECRDFESAMGKYRVVKLALQIAEKYKGRTIYFPHSYDFRGRIYPLAIGLSPQGSDVVKSLLSYANGEPLDRKGAEWCFAYLASLYGDDKINFKDRVQRGMDLIDADWKDADEPYQFLAHQIELKEVLLDPSKPFHGRIHLDACNSGSQFTSAITGDRAGCEATNVIPTIDKETGLCIRKDAYLLVAEKAKELTEQQIQECELQGDNEGLERNQFFLSLLEQDGRKICKTPVMVSNYGGTAGGRSEILWNMMREMGVDRKWITKKTASAFSKIIGDSITGVLNGGKAFENYIHKMNNVIASNNKPIWWTTTDGFHIVHIKHKELKSKQVSCLLPGSRRQTTIIKKMYSKNVSVTKMKSAISPNYIHSLDAELLRRTALKMRNNGIIDSDWIHDSFGCHPNYVGEMLEITKHEFLKMMKKLPLNTLDAELRSQMKSRKKKDKEMLEKIKIPKLRGFNISGGDLDVIKKSEWFFS